MNSLLQLYLASWTSELWWVCPPTHIRSWTLYIHFKLWTTFLGLELRILESFEMSTRRNVNFQSFPSLTPTRRRLHSFNIWTRSIVRGKKTNFASSFWKASKTCERMNELLDLPLNPCLTSPCCYVFLTAAAAFYSASGGTERELSETAWMRLHRNVCNNNGGGKRARIWLIVCLWLLKNGPKKGLRAFDDPMYS